MSKMWAARWVSTPVDQVTQELLLGLRDLGVEIGSRKPNAAVGGFDQDVRQDWQCRFAGNAGSDRRQPFLEFFTRDRKSHQLLGVHRIDAGRTPCLAIDPAV